MADGGRRYGLAPKLDLGIILTEAQHRWLRPAEVCEILRNYKKFQLSSEPPHKPTDGSLFLFDRKALRYFRKDGHKWRKKKDGKTVREAHERLKSGSIDVLHCYYAHGEENEHFQRRSYWMLEEQFEHIVLVHYREIKEGNKTGTYPSTSSQRSMQLANSTVNTGHVLSGQAHANSPLGQKSYASSPSISERNGTNHSSDFEEVESGDDIGNSVNIETDSSSVEHGCSQLQERNRDLPIETSFQQLEFGKEFANLPAENERHCSSYALNKMLPGQFHLGGLETVHRNLFEHASEPPVTLPYQDSYVPDYCKREVLNLADNLGLQQDRFSGHVQFPSAVTSEVPGCGYVNIGGNAIESGADVITSGQDINSSTWTEVLELCKSHIPNAARERNTTNLTPVTLDGFLGRQTQTGITFQTLKDNEVSIRNDADRNACLQTAVGPGSSEQDQIQGSAYSVLNDLQERILNFNDVEQVREPVSLQKFQERRLEVENKVKLENGNFENLSNIQINKQKLQHCNSSSDWQEKLKKLDSFNRWMNREMGVDSDKALLSGEPGMYWTSLGDQNGVEEIPNLTRHMQLENDLMVPSVSQVQLFSILEFSPDWAYTQSKTKVLIYGMFMAEIQDIYKHKFSVMFGEVEVSAEVLGPGILRCYTPPHAPGTVPFYVTCSNRVACSEVREFQYKVASFQEPHSSKDMDENVIQEILLKMRFAKLINQDVDKTVVSLKEEGDLNLRHSISSLISDFGEEWKELEHSVKEQQLCSEKIQERLTQKLLKEKLYYWLLWKSYNGGGPHISDDHGQGIIHLAAALGYDWAMSPIISSGLNVNFRDSRGWTALHWAAYYGRERTISSLIALKANPGALTDPTHEFPSGRTPADLAASNGNKGIAGYLAESSLTSHLSSLTLNENIMGSVVATLAAEKAVETVSERNVVQSDGAREDQLSLKDSLAAVRNAAQAAARIQASFRMHSFRRRQAIEYVEAKEEFTERQTLTRFSKASKSGSHEEPLHAAATHIQRKFRGWKGRKEFLLTRQRIVKIQAHFRGHQVRKKYRLVWSVGIVEKAILRWRRKGTGLRGFRPEGIEESSENIKRPEIDDYEYLRAARKQTETGVEKALARVQSMVQYPEARDQYRRLLAIYKESKAEVESNMLDS